MEESKGGDDDANLNEAQSPTEARINPSGKLSDTDEVQDQNEE